MRRGPSFTAPRGPQVPTVDCLMAQCGDPQKLTCEGGRESGEAARRKDPSSVLGWSSGLRVWAWRILGFGGRKPRRRLRAAPLLKPSGNLAVDLSCKAAGNQPTLRGLRKVPARPLWSFHLVLPLRAGRSPCPLSGSQRGPLGAGWEQVPHEDLCCVFSLK